MKTQLSIRITKEDKNKIKNIAEDCGKTPSTICEILLSQILNKENKELMKCFLKDNIKIPEFKTLK